MKSSLILPLVLLGAVALIPAAESVAHHQPTELHDWDAIQYPQIPALPDGTVPSTAPASRTRMSAWSSR